MDVCNAVRHSLHEGSIHSDPKPSNILATFLGDQSMSKASGIGAATAINQKLAAPTLSTNFDRRTSTPELGQEANPPRSESS
jgi:hypothetical protein